MIESSEADQYYWILSYSDAERATDMFLRWKHTYSAISGIQDAVLIGACIRMNLRRGAASAYGLLRPIESLYDRHVRP